MAVKRYITNIEENEIFATNFILFSERLEKEGKKNTKMVGLDFSIGDKNVLSICISIVILGTLMNAFSFKTGIHLQLHKEEKDWGNKPYLGLKSRNAGSALWLCSSAVPASTE